MGAGHPLRYPPGSTLGSLMPILKDTDLVQAANIFNVYGSLDKEIVRQGGTIVLVTASSEGKGFHCLHGKGMRLHIPVEENIIYSKIIRSRNMIIFSPNINLFDVQELYPENTLLMKKWTEVIQNLAKDYPDRPRVAIFPCASIQFPRDDLIFESLEGR